MRSILYLSYDGALDPLGRSQVVPYLEGLSSQGFRFDLITFEKPHHWRDLPSRREMTERLEASSIAWHPLRYTRRPPVISTGLDLWMGYRKALALWPVRKWALIHSRSYPSSVIARRLSRKKGIPFVFDMRGFYPEERVDGGLWGGGGILFQLTKRVEADLLRDASAVVTLTHASLPILQSLVERVGSRAEIKVIPTSVDLTRFEPSPSSPGNPFVLAYLGSLGTWYLLEEMLQLGRVCLREIPDSRLRFLVNGDPGVPEAWVKRMGMPLDRIEILSVPHEEVPSALRGVSATFFLIKPAPSKISSSATKFGESLAMGLPVLVNRGIGDSAEIVEREGVGVVLDRMGDESYRDAIARLRSLTLDPGVGPRCRRVAEVHYHLAQAVSAYADLFDSVLDKKLKT